MFMSTNHRLNNHRGSRNHWVIIIMSYYNNDHIRIFLSFTLYRCYSLLQKTLLLKCFVGLTSIQFFYTFPKCFSGVQFYRHLITNHIHCFPQTDTVTVAVQLSFPHKHLHFQSLTVHTPACLAPPLSVSLSLSECLLCWLSYHQHVL